VRRITATIKLVVGLSLLNPSVLLSQEGLLRLSDIISADESMFEPLAQKQIENLEDQLIGAFNTSNKIEDFKITCLRETKNGSYFFRACDPAFLIKERQANSVAWREGKEKLLTKEAIRIQFEEELRDLDVAFSKMLDENKKFYEMAQSLLKLKESLN
tara:strand:- start:920 stop:1393 length:474 start_codon:yes stop_codon:yes gene_type:complete